MICRIWRGRTTDGKAQTYEQILRDQVIPEIESRRIPGFLSMDLMKRPLGDMVEFLTIMWFDNLDAVKNFAGEDYDFAYVPPEGRAVLSEFDERSAHYEVLDRRDQRRSSRARD
jgi:antibiotic biosynthesis monooxygenase (ABM) superfamily enzyme